MAHEQSTENLLHLMPACLDYRDIPKKMTTELLLLNVPHAHWEMDNYFKSF